MTQETTRKNAFSPILDFVRKSTFSSILLFFSAILALVLANSPALPYMESLLDMKIGFTVGNFSVYKSLLLWINDGLMSIFFFVVGLELKREIVAGELSNPKNVVMPIVGAIGGMLIPALIYFGFNAQSGTESINGWGIPMATDIAFALGVLYLLGPRVPIQLKVFLTALAIIDDIGAVLVVAIFYSSQLHLDQLAIGGGILLLMFILNRVGVRSVLIYAILGIGGVWLAFLLSGVHATIAAVLAAFTIPSNRAIHKGYFINTLKELKLEFKSAKASQNEKHLLSPEEEQAIYQIRNIANQSISPLQKLEHSMHTLVLYVVMPIFALANAGVTLGSDFVEMLTSRVALGVMAGLIVGKLIGVFGLSMIGIKLKWYKMPENMNIQMVLGTAFLAAIGFTMSLFINSLAFENELYIDQAKMGILAASILSGFMGYFILKNAINKQERNSGKAQ